MVADRRVMKVHTAEFLAKDAWPEGLPEALATFAPLGQERVVTIHDDRIVIRVSEAAAVEIPFEEIEAAGTGAFRVLYPGNPVEERPGSTRLAPALVLYLYERVALDEFRREAPSQTYWDPARRHVWAHARHGLMVEWDGLTPGIATALELLKVAKAKGEMEMPAALSGPTAAEQAEPVREGGQVLGGLLFFALVTGAFWWGGTDEAEERKLLEAEKRRGHPVLERQGATAIEWGARVWDRGRRANWPCVGFAATRRGSRETGRYCERNGAAYVVWDEDRVQK